MKLSDNTLNLIAETLQAIETETSALYNAKREAFTSDQIAADYFKIKLSHLESEQFEVAFLDSQHRLIECRTMFKGTINAASVYPREVAKLALELNAAVVILAHNHPSGLLEPSQADISITNKLKEGLALFDINTLDHIIVAGNNHISFSSRGLL